MNCSLRVRPAVGFQRCMPVVVWRSPLFRSFFLVHLSQYAEKGPIRTSTSSRPINKLSGLFLFCFFLHLDDISASHRLLLLYCGKISFFYLEVIGIGFYRLHFKYVLWFLSKSQRRLTSYLYTLQIPR